MSIIELVGRFESPELKREPKDYFLEPVFRIGGGR